MRLLLILSIVMSTYTAGAQEPIVITGRYYNRVRLSRQIASELFIQEHARISFPSFTLQSVYTLKLDEESEQRLGKQTIGVILVNNAGVIRPPLYGEKPLTLEIYPFKDNIYFCKSYAHQEVSNQLSMKMYDDIERDITLFLQHPEQCDTLKQPSVWVDSRYTPLLIKNLSNDQPVYIEQILHSDGVKYTKFLGIVIKKENTGYSSTSYEPTRMSDFARRRLKDIFRPIRWDFDFPDASASADAWQEWLDKLLENNHLHCIEYQSR